MRHRTRHEIEVEDLSRRGVMLTIVAAHLSVAVLWAIGRLLFEHPAEDPLLQQVASSALWVALHLLAAAAVLVAAARQRRESAALAFSAGVMGAWATLRGLWALTIQGANEPLVGGALGCVIAVATYGLCMSYSAQPPPRG